VLLALLLTSPALAAAAPQPPGPRTDPAYAGSESCRPCHAAAYDAWLTSDHRHAIEPATLESVRGDFRDTTFSAPDGTSRFTRTGDRFTVRTAGPDGADHDFPVPYTFGIRPLQQYLLPLPGGRLQALSVAWDTDRKRWFHLYPDERVDHRDILHWTRPSQNWNDRCAECHSTALRKGFDREHDGYATTWTELSVGCESCHGPGADHVRWAEATQRAGRTPAANEPNGLVVDYGADGPAMWVLDPATGTAKRSVERRSHAELETCAACHARRATLTDAYRPGEPFLDSHRPALLDDGLYFPDGQIQDEVYEYASFLQSRMYHAGVTCSDCHDPHSGRLRATGDALCARCHEPARFATKAHHHHPPESDAARCVACHMPTRTYMVVDPRRDHSFRVPRPDLAEQTGSPNACTECHRDRSPQWAADAIVQWYGTPKRREWHFGEAIHAARRYHGDGEAGLLKLLGTDTAPAIARATAVSLLPRYPGPRTAAAVARAATDPDALLRLAAVDASAMLPPAERVRLLAPLAGDPLRAVRIDAGAALAAVPEAALAPSQRPARTRALDEYRAVQMENADRPDARLNLGLLAADLGQADTARAEYEAAMRIEPQFVPAYVNLADLHRAQGRDADADAVLRRGLAQVPDSAELHHALGLTLVRQQRVGDAVSELGRAAQLAPNDPRYAYVYGIALDSIGESARAVNVLRGAHDRFPGDWQLLSALVTVSRDAGQTADARRYAERLVALRPDDPQARQLRAQLGAPGGTGAPVAP